MDVPLNKLLRLLDDDQPAEVRRAALVVLGEAGTKGAEVNARIVQMLQDADPGVRLHAIAAAGKLRVERALPELLARVQKGGPEAEPAAQAAAQLGSKALEAMEGLMHEVAPGLRRYLAAALAGSNASHADVHRLNVLLDTDPAVVNAAARTLLEKAPALSDKDRHALADQVLKLLRDARKKNLSHASLSALIRLAAALGEAKAESFLWEHVGAHDHDEVRAAALQALGKLGVSPSTDHLHKLLVCAQERHFAVVAPALLLLRPLDVQKRNLGDWLALFDAPDVAARQLAVEKLGEIDTPTLADALLAQQQHPDQQLRERALAALTSLKSGQKVLLGALHKADSADRAWNMSKALAPLVKDYPAAWRKGVFEHACKLLEASDNRAEPLFFLLRQADSKDLRERLEERALALRKKKAYDKALLYLKILGRDPACGLPLRLELAGCGLKLSGKELTPEAVHHDPALEQFDSLARHHGDEAAAALSGMKWLDGDDLYYVGFHLAGKDGLSRKFAEKVLQLVLKRGGKSKVAQAARSKLRKEGLKEK